MGKYDLTRDEAEKIERVVHRLQGTCMNLQDVLEENDLEDTEAVCHAIDTEIFECDGCGWWFELSEMGSDHGGVQLCDSCADGGDEGTDDED
jgi:hypothetical protein